MPISSDAATWGFHVANAFLIGALVVGLIATFAIYWLGNIKEDYSQERSDKLENDTAQAKARTAEAELRLEELRRRLAPRQINGVEFIEALKGKPKAFIEILYRRDDGEAFALALQFRDWLKAAAWTSNEPSPIGASESARLTMQPSTVGVGGQPSGVTIVARADSNEDFRILGDRDANTTINALRVALERSMGGAAVSLNSEAAPKKGVLRLVVGQKP